MDFLEAMGYLGDTLDKPGRAVRGLLSGNVREGAAVVPFSDSLGLTDPAERVSGKQLLGTDSDLLGFGAELATDPLTLFGGAIGGRLGRLAGGKLTEAAAARGPRYATTANDLTEMAGGAGKLFQNKVGDLLGSPNASRILSEIPPGSKPLGAGAEGAALMTPRGDVLRLGFEPLGVPGRPIDPGVLKATRSVDIPFGGQGMMVRAERSPYATNVGNVGHWAETYGTGTNRTLELQSDLAGRGLDFFDRHAGNLGTHGGRPVVIDPGAIESAAYAGPRVASTQAAEPSRLMAALLDTIGATRRTRAAIDAGLPYHNYSPLLAELGAGAGSIAPNLGR